ncbi:MAG: DoxX family membrane protein [Bacteroidota bacterium]
MKKIRTPLQTLDEHNHLAYALIRSMVGFALFVRGWIYIAAPETISDLGAADSQSMWFTYIAFAHLAGGLLLMVGLLSRLAAIFQIPIMAGAVFIVNIDHGFASINQSLELSALLFILLIVFSLFGSGSYSIDEVIHRRKFTKNEESGKFITPKNI